MVNTICNKTGGFNFINKRTKEKVINSCRGSDVSRDECRQEVFKIQFCTKPQDISTSTLWITDIKQIMGVGVNTVDATEIKWSIQYRH